MNHLALADAADGGKIAWLQQVAGNDGLWRCAKEVSPLQPCRKECFRYVPVL
jgi:hypothetical protein